MATYTMTFSFHTTSGLTLEAVVKDTTGAIQSGPTTAGFTEESGSGYYIWTGTIPTGLRGWIIFRVSGGGAVQSVFSINPEELELLTGYYIKDAVASITDSTHFAGSSSLSTTDTEYNKQCIVFTSGVLKGRTGYVTAYTGSTKTFTLQDPLPSGLAVNDSFAILGLVP